MNIQVGLSATLPQAEEPTCSIPLNPPRPQEYDPFQGAIASYKAVKVGRHVNKREPNETQDKVHTVAEPSAAISGPVAVSNVVQERPPTWFTDLLYNSNRA